MPMSVVSMNFIVRCKLVMGVLFVGVVYDIHLGTYC